MVKEKFKTVLTRCDAKRYELASIAIATAATCPIATYAADTATGKVLTLLGVIIDVFPAIGIVLALVGAFKLFMAFRNDQPDAYSGAAKDIVIGIILIVFKTVVWPTLSGLV